MTNNKGLKIIIVLLAIAIVLTLMQSTLNAAAAEDVSQLEITASNVEIVPEATINENVETELSNEIFEEIKDRSKLIYALCNEESEETQIAIMATVHNREESSDFPDTFYEVIETSEILAEVWEEEAADSNFEELPEEPFEVVMQVLQGYDPTEWLLREEAIRLGLDPAEYADGGALHFHNLSDCDQQMLESIKVKVTIGDYIFYKM